VSCGASNDLPTPMTRAPAQPTVRAATLDDLPRVCELAQDLAALHHEAWPSQFAPPAAGTRDEAHWRDSLAGADRAGFVAELDGAVVGFMTLVVAQDVHSVLQPRRYVRVNSICVDREVRGRGVGSALMAQAEAWGRSQGASEVRLVVWAFNRTALRLYEELGYELRSHTMGKML